MPRKKQVSGGVSAKAPFGSKSAFVRGLPMDLPAKEVISRAKAQGMTLSVAQVYNIRSTAKLKTNAGVPSSSSASSSASPSPRPAAARVAQRAPSDSEARLRRLIAEIGLARSNEILKEVVAVFGG